MTQPPSIEDILAAQRNDAMNVLANAVFEREQLRVQLAAAVQQLSETEAARDAALSQVGALLAENAVLKTRRD